MQLRPGQVLADLGEKVMPRIRVRVRERDRTILQGIASVEFMYPRVEAASVELN